MTDLTDASRAMARRLLDAIESRLATALALYPTRDVPGEPRPDRAVREVVALLCLCLREYRRAVQTGDWSRLTELWLVAAMWHAEQPDGVVPGRN